MFSRRNSQSKAGPASGGHDASLHAVGLGAAERWPWEPDQSVAAELAIGSLRKFLLKSLVKDERLQVETLFCAVGALAGFSAQHAVRHEQAAHAADGTAAFVVAEAASGERYYFGDRLNAILVPERRDSIAVWSVIAGEAMRVGENRENLPDCMEIFTRVATSIGTPRFGVPELPAGHKPWLMPRRSVEIFWPTVLTVFTREPVVPLAGFKLVAPGHWPLVLAVVAASYLSALQHALTPGLAVRIFMEAAIPMSKIDPAMLTFVRHAVH
jgi:hypothetical protein